jgi:metal-dependent amidase/aminoacylase/carboxypeptidase family protein
MNERLSDECVRTYAEVDDGGIPERKMMAVELLESRAALHELAELSWHGGEVVNAAHYRKILSALGYEPKLET